MKNLWYKWRKKIKRMEQWMVTHTDPEYFIARKRKREKKWTRKKD